MSYLVLLKFNSIQNADNFQARYSSPLQATNAQIPQGYTPLGSTGVGSPNPGARPATSTFVTIEVSTLDQIPQGFSPEFIFNHSNNTVVYSSPNIDPNTITLKQGDNTVFQNGVPIPDPTVTNYPYPIDPNLFPPIFDQPDLRKAIQRGQLDQPIEKQDLPPEPIPEPYVNPYDITDPRNIERLFPEIKPDPNKPIFMNPETDPNLDPNLLIQPPRDTAPMEIPDLPQRHLDPKNPTLEPMEIPTPISDSGQGGGLSGPSGPIFVLAQAEAYSGPNQISQAQVWWSTNAIVWNLATIPITALPSLRNGGNAQSSTPVYRNGLWVFSYQWDYIGNGTFADAIIFSFDGRNWNVAFVPTGSQQGAGVIFMTATFQSANNRFFLDNTNFVSPGQVINIFLNCSNPVTASNKILLGDSFTFASQTVIVDPAQPGTGFYARNSLPPGITAIQVNNDGTNDIFQYTTTVITQAIVNNSFAGVTWLTSLKVPSSGGYVFYGQPSGLLIV